MEDSDQNIHLKNLSVHQASNEEDALNLLFLGDTNRMIAEVGKFLKYFDFVTFEPGREKPAFYICEKERVKSTVLLCRLVGAFAA